MEPKAFEKGVIGPRTLMRTWGTRTVSFGPMLGLGVLLFFLGALEVCQVGEAKGVTRG